MVTTDKETVIAVAKKIGEFKADPWRGSFSAWLMHTTRWRIADQFRKRQAEAERNKAGDTPPLQGEDTGLPWSMDIFNALTSHFSLPLPDTLSHTLSELAEFESNVRSRKTAGLRQSTGFCRQEFGKK